MNLPGEASHTNVKKKGRRIENLLTWQKTAYPQRFCLEIYLARGREIRKGEGLQTPQGRGPTFSIPDDSSSGRPICTHVWKGGKSTELHPAAFRKGKLQIRNNFDELIILEEKGGGNSRVMTWGSGGLYSSFNVMDVFASKEKRRKKEEMASPLLDKKESMLGTQAFLSGGARKPAKRGRFRHRVTSWLFLVSKFSAESGEGEKGGVPCNIRGELLQKVSYSAGRIRRPDFHSGGKGEKERKLPSIGVEEKVQSGEALRHFIIGKKRQLNYISGNRQLPFIARRGGFRGRGGISGRMEEKKKRSRSVALESRGILASRWDMKYSLLALEKERTSTSTKKKGRRRKGISAWGDAGKGGERIGGLTELSACFKKKKKNTEEVGKERGKKERGRENHTYTAREKA